MTYIELKDVKKEFEIGDFVVIALDNINLAIEKNEFVNIKGASGAGKTSLLNIMGSLDKPTSGKVIIDGIDITTLSEEALSPWRATNLGFVFQSFNLILSWEMRTGTISRKLDIVPEFSFSGIQ